MENVDVISDIVTAAGDYPDDRLPDVGWADQFANVEDPLENLKDTVQEYARDLAAATFVSLADLIAYAVYQAYREPSVIANLAAVEEAGGSDLSGFRHNFWRLVKSKYEAYEEEGPEEAASGEVGLAERGWTRLP